MCVFLRCFFSFSCASWLQLVLVVLMWLRLPETHAAPAVIDMQMEVNRPATALQSYMMCLGGKGQSCCFCQTVFLLICPFVSYRFSHSHPSFFLPSLRVLWATNHRCCLFCVLCLVFLLFFFSYSPISCCPLLRYFLNLTTCLHLLVCVV